jgi:hypothetical protein
MLKNPLAEYYRIPTHLVKFELLDVPKERDGYFRFGPEIIGYGRTCSDTVTRSPGSGLNDLSSLVKFHDSTCFLPFDANEIIDNLRHERYVNRKQDCNASSVLRDKLYYAVRGFLPFAFRTRLKRIVQRGWDHKIFPRWPVDLTVEKTLERLLLLVLERQHTDGVPFIWFWPRGYASCILMTHDVETQAGLDFCSTLMDINESYGIRSAFQLVPEGRYPSSQSLREEIRCRGHETNIHDWNHDGRLFSDPAIFAERAKNINQTADEYGAKGFRSGALYRNLDWYEALSVAYDMSIPNVAHLDPQAGGCCTVMPFFIGKILEIPVTTVQDYMLFHLLRDYSIALWKAQLQQILSINGLASFIVHPDYIIEGRARSVYADLLAHLALMVSQEHSWNALPGELNQWWRNRSQMSLVQRNGDWEIDGPGSEQACIAWASVRGSRLIYTRDKDVHGQGTELQVEV